MIQGHTNKAMAGDLSLSQRTVELYRARVMEKTGSRSLSQLVCMAVFIVLGIAAATKFRVEAVPAT